MSAISMAAIFALLVFAAGGVGLELQRRLPEGYTTGSSRDTIGAISGLLGLFLALVLGLLIWTSYGVYSNQKLSLNTLAFNIFKFDAALKEYGPETNDLRRAVNEAVKRAIVETWSERDPNAFVVKVFGQALNGLRQREVLLDELKPSTEEQKALLSAAKQASAAISQERAQMALALIDPISYPLVGMVIAWATILFFAYGLQSKRHPMTILTIAVGAVAVASATYLILDFSNPYSGLFGLSPAPIQDVLKALL
jgi:Protein of unknown function (DUF4239)